MTPACESGGEESESVRAPFSRGGNGANTRHQGDSGRHHAAFPCFIEGCGLFAGDVHFAQGNGEVAGTAIEMGAKVTLQAKVSVSPRWGRYFIFII
jgi:formamidase